MKVGRMSKVLREQRTECLEQNYFGRSIDDIVSHNFFTSFDANIYRHNDYYLIEVAVPGFRKKDLSIHVDDGILLVTATKKEQEPGNSEFSYASFNRSFVLPPDADIERVNARCRDGMLRIRLTKIANRTSGRIIPVSGRSAISWWSSLRERLRQWIPF